MSVFAAAYLYDEVTVRGCPLQWKVIPFAFIEMGWMEIDRSFVYTNCIKEKVKSTVSADSKVVTQAD